MTRNDCANEDEVKELLEIAHVAGWDAGNRSMRKAGRKVWNSEDWNEATRAYNQVVGEPPSALPPR